MLTILNNTVLVLVCMLHYMIPYYILIPYSGYPSFAGVGSILDRIHFLIFFGVFLWIVVLQ